MSIFRAYDIRGLYPSEITPDIVRKVGSALVKFTGAKTIAVGRDMRPSGNDLCPALCEGIASAGGKVVDIGLVSTPLFYFAVQNYPEHEAGVMVTASHNPAEYNGLKMVMADGMPIGAESGMKDIEKMVNEMSEAPSVKCESTEKSVIDDYISKLFSFIDPTEIKPLRVVVDAGNGMAGAVVPHIFKKLKCIMTPMYFELDGTFPNHEANPIIPENTKDLSDMVLKTHADIGVGFDGDADRIGFVDEKGDLITGDLITAILAKELLSENKGAKILYDVRESRSVAEVITEAGGKALMSRVGHSFIKAQMQKEDALFAGEFSAHYYFKEFGNLDNSDYALLLMLGLLSKAKRPLSELVKDVRRYAHSGEINFEAQNKQEVIDKLREKYEREAREVTDIDGIRLDFEDWWFNVRASNTEPKLRLNLEARNEAQMEEKKSQLIKEIEDFSF